MTSATKTVQTAQILAFVLPAFAFLTIFLNGSLLVLIPGVFLCAAGFGLMRRQVWSAYASALYLFTYAMNNSILVSQGAVNSPVRYMLMTVFGLVASWLFFRAGRDLEAAGARRGHGWTWIAISLLVSLPFLFLEAYEVGSRSMEDTALWGDRILFRVWPKPAPRFGEIWALHYPLNRREVYIKRIVGLPGDRIRLSSKIVYRNGVELPEAYAKHGSSRDTYRDDFPSGAVNVRLSSVAAELLEKNVVNDEAVVPEGCYFVLGDNRDDSDDSRYFGFVAAGDLIGKSFMIFDSEQPSDWTVLAGLPGRGKTRWDRLFRIP
jgi:signal peptidase I